MAEFLNEIELWTESGELLIVDLRNALIRSAAPDASTKGRQGMQCYVVSGNTISEEFVCTVVSGNRYTWVRRERQNTTVDTTLTVSGAAADAATVGEKLTEQNTKKADLDTVPNRAVMQGNTMKFQRSTVSNGATTTKNLFEVQIPTGGSSEGGTADGGGDGSLFPYIWKKYKGDPNTITYTDGSDVLYIAKRGYPTGNITTVYYSDEINTGMGGISLADPVQIDIPVTQDGATTAAVLKGKYVTLGNKPDIYYIPADARIIMAGSAPMYDIRATTYQTVEGAEFLGFVTAETSDAYPKNGVDSTDGCWYVGGGLIADLTDINAAVDVDDTLTVSGAAADAAVVGEKVAELSEAIANKADILIDLKKYGITRADYTAPFTADMYTVAYNNGVGIQNAINDAIARGQRDVTIPPGNYPLCYHAESWDDYNPIIDARGINFLGYGAKLYVIYDEEGTNPYYNPGEGALHSLSGTIIMTDHDVCGLELVGEREYRTISPGWMEHSFGVELTKNCNGNKIIDCKIHRISGDGVGSGLSFDGNSYISGNMACSAATMENGVQRESTTNWLSLRMGFGNSVKMDEYAHICSTGNSYFLWTTKPIKLHCFTQEDVYIRTITVLQGVPFLFPPNTFYVYVETTGEGTHDTTATTNYNFRCGNAIYQNTVIDRCEIFCNQRGGISNLPSGSVVRNCNIYENGSAYGSMVAYHDSTTFGIDIEDWYIHNITIENCLFHGNRLDVIFRCNKISMTDCVLMGDLYSLNYAVDVMLHQCKIYGSVAFTTPASFGEKVAVGCEFYGAVNDALQVIGKSGIDVTDATVGQIIQIAAVDENGVPTAWSPVDMPSGGGDSESSTWKTVCTYVLENDATKFTINKDDNGNPFEYDHLIVEAYFVGSSANTTDANAKVNFLVDGVEVTTSLACAYGARSAGKDSGGGFECITPRNKAVPVVVSRVVQMNQTTYVGNTNRVNTVKKKCTGLVMWGESSSFIGAGTIISVYGMNY